MRCNLKDRVVKPGCQLLEADGLATITRPKAVQRFLLSLLAYNPDHNLAARPMEDIAWSMAGV